jgi:hypothetical protein
MPSVWETPSEKCEDRMSAKAGFPSALVLIVLGLSTAQGGNPSLQPGQAVATPAAEDKTLLADPKTLEEMLPSPKIVAPGPGEATPAIAEKPSTFQLSSWILNPRPDCCGPVGGNGPVLTELYVRTGPALIVGGGAFNHLLNNGWKVQGGGRSLFYDPEQSAAWTVDLSLDDVYNQGQKINSVVLNVSPRPTAAQMLAGTILPARRIVAHINDLNRTDGNACLGREWQLGFLQNAWDIRTRVGFDIGGRLGTMLAHIQDEKHRTDVLYGIITSLHTDVEIPRGCFTFVTGVRVEWDHEWTSILQSQNNSNIADLNVLLTFGVRF